MISEFQTIYTFKFVTFIKSQLGGTVENFSTDAQRHFLPYSKLQRHLKFAYYYMLYAGFAAQTYQS